MFGIFIISYFAYVITENKIAKIIFNFVVSPAFVLTFAIFTQYCFNLPIHLIKNPIYKFILFSLRPFLAIATVLVGTDFIEYVNSKANTLHIIINKNKKPNQEVIQMNLGKKSKLNEETNRRLKIIEKESEKIKDKDSFVVVVGSDKDNTTLNYKNVCLKYLEKNHSDKIYYVNLAKENNATTYIQKTFKTDDGTIPSTFVMKNGKVKVQKSGSLSYYRIAELFK